LQVSVHYCFFISLYFILRSLQAGVQNIFQEIYGPLQNSRHQNVNMKHVQQCGPTYIRRHLKRTSRQYELECGF